MRNRLSSTSGFTDSVDSLDQQSVGFDDPTFSDDQVCLFGPERYEPSYEYPLVVWLHSCGSGERELGNVMPELSLQNYVACAPRGPSACDGRGSRFKWGSGPASTAIAEEVVFDAIDVAAREFSVRRDKVFLAGFGSGATTAWRIALRYPTRFAGVVSVCGNFPTEDSPLTNYNSARNLATLWMYGADSPRCGIEQVCESLPVMHAASLSVDIRQYPCGDELLTNMLSDANNWLMERVTGQVVSDERVPEENLSQN